MERNLLYSKSMNLNVNLIDRPRVSSRRPSRSPPDSLGASRPPPRGNLVLYNARGAPGLEELRRRLRAGWGLSAWGPGESGSGGRGGGGALAGSVSLLRLRGVHRVWKPGCLGLGAEWTSATLCAVLRRCVATSVTLELKTGSSMRTEQVIITVYWDSFPQRPVPSCLFLIVKFDKVCVCVFD